MFLPYPALILSLLIDGVAGIIFLLHGDARITQFLDYGSIFQSTTLCREGEKHHLNIENFAFADDGNQTRPACASSECAIHYTIASQTQNKMLHCPFLLWLRSVEKVFCILLNELKLLNI